MFLKAEPDQAISFTDETSRRKEPSTDRRVWTHAQILRTDLLAWFKELFSLYPDFVVNGELESVRVAESLEKLPWDVKRRILSGLRNARIHIVDTFAYEARFKQIIRAIYKCDDYEKILRENENPQVSKMIILGMEDFVTESILLDSPAQRIEQNLEAKRMGMYGYGLVSFEQQQRRQELAIDITPFRKKRKKPHDIAAKWVSKSGSVFADAVEFSGYASWGEYESRQYLAEMLSTSHAFDEGDDDSIKWLEEQRGHFKSGYYNPYYFGGVLYGNIDSRLSVRTQAADIAAKIAQRFYDEHGLEALVDTFDFVTFNGERINEVNFEATTEFWNHITEHEEKIQKLLSGL